MMTKRTTTTSWWSRNGVAVAGWATVGAVVVATDWIAVRRGRHTMSEQIGRALHHWAGGPVVAAATAALGWHIHQTQRAHRAH